MCLHTSFTVGSSFLDGIRLLTHQTDWGKNMTVLRNKFILSTALATSLFAFSNASAFEFADIEAEPNLITVGDPADPKYANAGDNLRNGVGSIFVQFPETGNGGFLCTASAISPTHILTAAHCVTAADWTVSRIRFILNAGLPAPMLLEASGFAVHPWYPIFLPFYGAFAHGDMAVIELAEPLPEGIDIYELYRNSDEFNQEARHYGHGRSGKGNKGATGGANLFFARTGLNTYEQNLSPLLGDGIPDQLLSDFDSGGRKHNAMGWWFSSQVRCAPENDTPPHAQDGQCTTFKDGRYPDFKGFGKDEVGIASGDSGGPAFIDGKIAGVHSFGFTHRCSGVTNGTDFSCGLNSSYGEMSGDTRVSFHADFIDDVVSGVFSTTPVGAPAAMETTESAAMASEILSPNGKYFIDGVKSATMQARIK